MYSNFQIPRQLLRGLMMWSAAPFPTNWQYSGCSRAHRARESSLVVLSLTMHPFIHRMKGNTFWLPKILVNDKRIVL